MPIPEPRKDESQNEFMKRCMINETMIKEYDIEQRAAICRSQYEKKLEKHESNGKNRKT